MSNVKKRQGKARSAKKTATESELSPVKGTMEYSELDYPSAKQEAFDGKAITDNAVEWLDAEYQRIAAKAETKFAELHKWIAEAADELKAGTNKITDL